MAEVKHINADKIAQGSEIIQHHCDVVLTGTLKRGTSFTVKGGNLTINRAKIHGSASAVVIEDIGGDIYLQPGVIIERGAINAGSNIHARGINLVDGKLISNENGAVFISHDSRISTNNSIGKGGSLIIAKTINIGSEIVKGANLRAAEIFAPRTYFDRCILEGVSVDCDSASDSKIALGYENKIDQEVQFSAKSLEGTEINVINFDGFIDITEAHKLKLNYVGDERDNLIIFTGGIIAYSAIANINTVRIDTANKTTVDDCQEVAIRVVKASEVRGSETKFSQIRAGQGYLRKSDEPFSR